jgi:hypothetical protein
MAHRRTECREAVAEMVERFPGAKVYFGFTNSAHQVAEIVFGDRTRKIFLRSNT